jgi:hypothetical protein
MGKGVKEESALVVTSVLLREKFLEEAEGKRKCGLVWRLAVTTCNESGCHEKQEESSFFTVFGEENIPTDDFLAKILHNHHATCLKKECTNEARHQQASQGANSRRNKELVKPNMLKPTLRSTRTWLCKDENV